MIVYRFEHETSGLGPYRLFEQHGILCECDNPWDHESDCHAAPVDRVCRAINYAHNDDAHPPTRGIHRSMVVGMNSVDSLMGWFAGYVSYLHEAGFYVQAFYVPMNRTISERADQILFNKDDAKPLTSIPIPGKV